MCLVQMENVPFEIVFHPGAQPEALVSSAKKGVDRLVQQVRPDVGSPGKCTVSSDNLRKGTERARDGIENKEKGSKSETVCAEVPDLSLNEGKLHEEENGCSKEHAQEGSGAVRLA